VPIPIQPVPATLVTSGAEFNAQAVVAPATRSRLGRSGAFALSSSTWAAILLPICALSFAGNHIVGRAVAGHVPPVALATGRWALASLILVPLAWPHLRRDWPQICAHWFILLFLTLLAGGLFSTLQYIGLVYTTALNTALLNSTVPVFIAVACFVLFGDRLSWRQAAGIGISLAGVVAIISKGDTGVAASWDFTSGDLIILANMALWSIYSAFLRYKPAIHWLSFGALMSVVALLANLPFLAIEHASGQVIPFTTTTLAAVTYAGIITSIVAFATWNYGVAAIGASRAGVFLHLIPVFGSILAVMLLGEPAGWYHGAGFALILAGVWLAGRSGSGSNA
jgi:drug/metabolite transporter (DMT)-like permease